MNHETNSRLSDEQIKAPLNRRVRAILLTGRGTVMLIKRVKRDVQPYWVAPGGGVEGDEDVIAALHRELMEELGAEADVLERAFVLRHSIAGKNLEEHFFICCLQDYDLELRSGPEFSDPTRGVYLPDEVPLTEDALETINIKTPELRDWMIRHLRLLNLRDSRIRIARHGIGQAWAHSTSTNTAI